MCGITDIEAGYCDVLGNNSARANDSMIANRDGKDGGVRPNTYMITKLGWPPQLPFRRRPPANKRIIDEHGAVRNEAIVPDRNQFADERVRLNPAPLTDSYVALYLDEGSYEAAVPNNTTI